VNHERDTIAAFIVAAKRKRYLEFVSQPRYRKKLIRELPHFKDFEPRYKRTIPGSRQAPVSLAALLSAKGAPTFCWVISEDSRVDAHHMPLLDALEEVVGTGMGTIVSCVPGRLAFVETEDERFILERSDYPLQRFKLVRFFATERDSDSHVEEGIFQAAYTLLRSDKLTYYEWKELRSLLDWFNEHLERPGSFSRSSQPRGICWFKPEATECLTHVWAMVHILKEHGVMVTKVTTEKPGYVVYEDEFQVVAEPFRQGTFK